MSSIAAPVWWIEQRSEVNVLTLSPSHRLWHLYCNSASSTYFASKAHKPTWQLTSRNKIHRTMVGVQVKEESQEGAQPKRTLGLRHTRTCKMSDDVLAVRVTPDGRLLALALLDSTVQVRKGICLLYRLLVSLEGEIIEVIAVQVFSLQMCTIPCEKSYLPSCRQALHFVDLSFLTSSIQASEHTVLKRSSWPDTTD